MFWNLLGPKNDLWPGQWYHNFTFSYDHHVVEDYLKFPTGVPKEPHKAAGRFRWYSNSFLKEMSSYKISNWLSKLKPVNSFWTRRLWSTADSLGEFTMLVSGTLNTYRGCSFLLFSFTNILQLFTWFLLIKETGSVNVRHPDSTAWGHVYCVSFNSHWPL